MACFAARLVPINAPGFHEDARNTSTTRSSMSLTTMVYCLGVLSPGPRTVTLGGRAGPLRAHAHSRRQDTVRITNCLEFIQQRNCLVVSFQGRVGKVQFIFPPQHFELVPSLLQLGER